MPGYPAELLLVAGEASGDLHGAHLARALLRHLPDLRLTGIGGTHMREAGVHLLFDITEISVVGIWEGGKVLGRLWQIYQTLRRRMTTSPCTALILIDFPEFNLRLARVAQKQGIPVLYYIAPQVWAWRPWRIRTIKRVVDKVFVILPFEPPFYQRAGVEAEFVGHPLLDQVQVTVERTTFCRQHQLDPHAPIVGILPGSRRHEINYMLPIMVRAAQQIRTSMPAVQFLLPLAPTLTPAAVLPHLTPNLGGMRVLEGETYPVMQVADFLIVASGTATLEAGLFQTPMVIVYRGHPLSALIAWFLLRVKHVGLVNLVAGTEVVPELLQFRMTPERITRVTLDYLQHPERLQQTREALGKVRA
ncbi:MAG: lipid-A-disaccharide synthase, partial [Nitrospinota bacterium]